MQSDTQEQIAVSQLFTTLINMKLLSSAIVMNREGQIVLDVTDSMVDDSVAWTDDVNRDDNSIIDYDNEDNYYEDGDGNAILRNNALAHVQSDEAIPTCYNNVAVSGMRTFQNMQQLRLGTPQYICTQFHNALVVQTTNGQCTLTLIGNRACGHTLGGLLTLLPQIVNSPYFIQMS